VGQDTRPLRARARKSLFDILGAEVAGSRFLDLYAGAGAVGIEAASRGAVEVVLVELGAQAARALNTSARNLGIEDRVRVERREVTAFLQRSTERFDLIFLGPPYRLCRDDPTTFLPTILTAAAARLAQTGLLVLETPFNSDLPDIPSLSLGESRRYGETALHFFRFLDSGPLKA